MIFIKRKLVMLPSENGNLMKPNESNRMLMAVYNGFTERFNRQDLYIISDEEIKDGDWFFVNNRATIFHADSVEYLNNAPISIEDSGHNRVFNYRDCSKVISTTDPTLQWADGGYPGELQIHAIPQIPKPFLYDYIDDWNKGQLIEEVLVEYEQHYSNEACAKECNDDFLKLKINPEDNTVTIKKVKNTFCRADIIHAFTSGHNKAKRGLTHADAFIEYKTKQNL